MLLHSADFTLQVAKYDAFDHYDATASIEKHVRILLEKETGYLKIFRLSYFYNLTI